MKTTLLLLAIAVSAARLLGQPGQTDTFIANSLKSTFPATELDYIDNIMRFNKDTVLVSGYLSDSAYSLAKNLVFQTFDGGKSWKKHYFNGSAWIYNTHFEPGGKVWMGGSDEYVHFSTDYGTTWTKKPKPFLPENRVLCIYMTDSLHGIAGGLHNGLAITGDNWQTTKQIPTPLDQNKFSVTDNSSRDRIKKVQVLGSLLLINQNDHIYYSRLNPIEWKTFTVPAKDFSINTPEKKIELFSIRNKVYVLDSALQLLATYFEPGNDPADDEYNNEKIDMDSFLAPGIKSAKIKAVKFVFDKFEGGCLPFALYKENKKEIRINNEQALLTLKKVLATCNTYEQPDAHSFLFSSEDVDDYHNYYNEIKAERQKEKAWGGDFTWLLDIENDLFINPQKTIYSIDQALLDTVYQPSASSLISIRQKQYVIANVINNKGELLKISSKNSSLYSLPWTIEYKERSFETYDTRITGFLKAAIPKGFNYYDKLFAGELIYRLIEQRIINETVYVNGY